MFRNNGALLKEAGVGDATIQDIIARATKIAQDGRHLSGVFAKAVTKRKKSNKNDVTGLQSSLENKLSTKWVRQ